jgi:photosystem II stability/assembly factor-like uncharacterized protein
MQLTRFTKRGVRPAAAAARFFRRRTRLSLLIAAALSLALLGTACGSKSATSQAHRTSSRSGNPHAQTVASVTIRAAHLIQGDAGWVLSNDALYMTSNGGQTWTGITPPGVPGGAVWGVYFLDTQHGWVVSSSATNPEQLEVSVTTDGGTSWSTSPLRSPNPMFTDVSAAYVEFVDAQHGWVAATIGPSNGGALPQGVLFQTTDGGATWQQLQMPVGGPVEFVSTTTGWLADGIQGEISPQFYVTSDGGRSWTPETVTPPTGFTQDQATYTIPSFTSPADVVLAAFDNGNSATAGFYQTNDSGSTWQLKAAVPAGNPGGDVSPSAAVVNPGAWVAASVNGTKITTITQDGASQVSISPAGFPADSGIGDASFTSTGTTGVGWVVVSTSQCAGSKSACTETTALFSTTDGGAHWAQLPIP